MSNNDQFDDLEDFDFDEAGDDLDAVSEEDAVADEDWDQFEADQGAGAPASETADKKKSGLFTLLLIGGVIIAGGGFLVLQMGQNPVPVQAVIEQPLPESPVAEIQNPPSAPPMPAPISQPEAPESSNDIEIMVPAPPSSASGPEIPDIPSEGSDAALRMPKADDILLKRAPAESAESRPVVDAAPVPEQQTLTEATIESAPALPKIPVTSNEAPAETGQILEKLDALSDRLEILEGRLETYQQEKTESSGGATAQINDLQQALESMEGRLDQLAKKQERGPVSQSDRESSSPSTIKPKPQILGQSTDTGAGTTEKPRSSRQATSVHWVLKGAQPGRAMVAKAGESDLKPVEVGDTLPGIGRITAIIYQDGKWLVNGTEGQISQ